MISKNEIINDLRTLGIKNGDILFISADLFNTGYFNLNKTNTLTDWIEIFKEAVGEDGCFVVGAYTKTFFRFNKSKDVIFHRYAKTSVGAFSSALIKHQDSVRSTHPTHSCIGVGKNIEKYLFNHTVKSTSYQVLNNIMEAKGKYLLLGTLDKKNSPQAMHLAQENLGYTKYSPYKWLFQTYYLDESNKKKIFTKTDFGGCSSGGYKLFGPLIVNEAIKFGDVGQAKSAVMEAVKSYEVINEILKNNKRFILCDNPKCTQCYGNFFYNRFGVLPFYFKKVLHLIVGNQKIKLG